VIALVVVVVVLLLFAQKAGMQKRNVNLDDQARHTNMINQRVCTHSRGVPSIAGSRDRFLDQEDNAWEDRGDDRPISWSENTLI
jgi:hypothetical protein